MFLQASVILLTGGERGVPHTPQNRHPPEQTPPPLPPGADPPGADPPSGADPPGEDPRRADTPPGSRQPPPPACCEIRSTRGRYASYWNAILFM